VAEPAAIPPERAGRPRRPRRPHVPVVDTRLRFTTTITHRATMTPAERSRRAWTGSRRIRVLGWAAAVGLTVYGGVLSVAGWLIEAGLVDAADDADEHALAWHAYVWDPWFALWGGAFVVAMWRSRPQPCG
jgi:hypothetical protein